MSEQILLLNPRPRRRRNRMPAALARYWAHRRGRSYRARGHNPRRRRHNRRHVARLHRRGHHYRAHNRHRRRTNRRRHRNPSIRGLLGGDIVKTYATPVVLGAVGGAALSFAWGYVAPKLPANLQAGWVGVGVKSAVAIGLAALVGRFLPRYRQQAHLAGLGAVLLTAAPPLISLVGGIMPGLSGYIDYQSYPVPMARGVHGYMSRGPGLSGLGDDLYSPAAVIQPPGTSVPRQFGGYIATQPNMLNGYIAVQPHVMGGGGLMGYDWQHDGM